MAEYSLIGKRIPQINSREKVTGEAIYCADLKIPGMLVGKIKRSPYPFARIISIDASKAQKIRGVKTVITARDVTQFPYGYIPDEVPLAFEYVRFVGDEVAAVAAIDEETAEEALDLIEVEYEELTPVLDVEKAMEPGAPAVHPELSGVKQNIAYNIDYTRGDGEAAFEQADLVLEERFSTQAAHQVYLEPQACIAHWDVSDKLTIWCSLQRPFVTRATIAKTLGIPEYRIRMIQLYVGGGFGGKGATPQRLYPISALLSKKAGKAVKIVLDRAEDLMAGRPRLSEIIDLRLGFKMDGTLIAESAVITANTGAYVELTPSILIASAVRHSCLYRNRNIKMVANLVYTNTIPKGSVRGYGNPQPLFALESMMDTAADKLGIDPTEIRLKNSTQNGDITVHGWIINSCGLDQSIHLAAEHSDWKEKRQKTKERNRGIGMACQVWVSGNRALHPLYDGSAALVRIDQYGKVTVISGEGEIGQGASTVFAQIAAEEIGVPLDDVKVLPVDTDVSPFCLGACASRVTVLGGNAIRLAAIDVKKQVLEHAARKLHAKPDDLEIKDGKIHVKEHLEEGTTLAAVAHEAIFRTGGVPITGKGSYTVPDSVVIPDVKTKYGNVSIAYTFGTQIAEVEVDPKTGKVDILNIWAAVDSGRVINPLTAEGQNEGGIVHGLGYALSEDYLWEEGRMLNANLSDYKVPISLDIPKIYSIFIETDNPGSPYGAKGIGEPPLNPTAPAIANAIYNAVGIRIKELPITPEKILTALQKKR